MKAYLDPKIEAFIRYLDFPGSEPSLIFIAGLGLASTAAFPRVVIEPSLFERRSILVDLLGFGYSDKPDHFGYSLEEHASTLSGLLDHIGSRKYILVGHSFGGSVAIELASKRPDLVIQIILAEANLEAGGGKMSSSIAKQNESNFINHGYQDFINAIRDNGLTGDEIAPIALGMWQLASPLGFHRSAVSLVKGTEPVMWDQLINLPIPRSFIFGSRSLDEYKEDQEMQQKLEAHGIQVAIVPAAGHGMMAENPVGFANVISKIITNNYQ